MPQYKELVDAVDAADAKLDWAVDEADPIDPDQISELTAVLDKAQARCKGFEVSTALLAGRSLAMAVRLAATCRILTGMQSCIECPRHHECDTNQLRARFEQLLK